MLFRSYLNEITDPAILKQFPEYVKNGRISRETLNAHLAGRGIPTALYQAAMAASKHQHVGSTDQFLYSLAEAGIINQKEVSNIHSEIDSLYNKAIKSQAYVSDAKNPYWKASNTIMKKHLYNNPDALAFWEKFSAEPAYAVSENLRSKIGRAHV